MCLTHNETRRREESWAVRDQTAKAAKVLKDAQTLVDCHNEKFKKKKEIDDEKIRVKTLTGDDLLVHKAQKKVIADAKKIKIKQTNDGKTSSSKGSLVECEVKSNQVIHKLVAYPLLASSVFYT